MLTRDRLNELQRSRRFGEVPFPMLGDGETVRLKRLTVAFLDSIQEDDPLRNARIVAESVVDTDDSAVFTPEEVGELDVELNNALTEAVQQFNGFTGPDADAESEKN